MKNRTFRDEQEELEFYREKSKKSNQIIDEIHDLLGIDKEYPKRLWLLQVNKEELVLIKWAIRDKINQLNKEIKK